MASAVFEPAILASERPQTNALDRAASGIGFRDLYFSPHYIGESSSTRMRLVWCVESREAGGVHTGFWWGDPTNRNHLQYLGFKRDNNIKMDLQKLGWLVMDWIVLVHDTDMDRSLWMK
jgi:hypothetical protein